jgi:hypothetical protein
MYHWLMLIWLVQPSGPAHLAAFAEYATEAQCQDGIDWRQVGLPAGRYFADCERIIVQGKRQFEVVGK